MRRIPATVLAALALACGPGEAGPTRPPDVLLVVLDTLRADHVSAYGHPRPTTPRLDALAEVGVLFEDVTAPSPWTWPSHASLFTGEPPWVHGARLTSDLATPPPPPRRDGDGDGGAPQPAAGPHGRFGRLVDGLRADLPTLAERFSAGGYRTVALVVNEWLSPDLGLLRGFEQARRLPNDAAMIEAAAAAIADPDPRPLFLFVNAMSAHSPFREGPGPWALPDRDFLDPERAPRWVRPYLAEGRPRGVHLSTLAPGDTAPGTARHAAGVLRIPEEGLANLRLLYAAGVRGADFALGRVLEPWVRAHPDSVVAVTSDHGEGFAEHGLLDHRVSVYPEVLHVPLVLAAPGLPAGVRVTAPVALERLHPTLLALAGLPAPPGSLVPLVREGGDPPALITATARPDVWALQAGGRFAASRHLYRTGGWALVWSPEGGAPAELYDLSNDPAMRRDLAVARPQRLAALRSEAARHFDARDASRGAPLDIPAELAGRLQALGYGL